MKWKFDKFAKHAQEIIWGSGVVLMLLVGFLFTYGGALWELLAPVVMVLGAMGAVGIGGWASYQLLSRVLAPGKSPPAPKVIPPHKKGTPPAAAPPPFPGAKSTAPRARPAPTVPPGAGTHRPVAAPSPLPPLPPAPPKIVDDTPKCPVCGHPLDRQVAVCVACGETVWCVEHQRPARECAICERARFAEYKRLMGQGDDLLKNKHYADALAIYEQAKQLVSGNDSQTVGAAIDLARTAEQKQEVEFFKGL